MNSMRPAALLGRFWLPGRAEEGRGYRGNTVQVAR